MSSPPAWRRFPVLAAQSSRSSTSLGVSKDRPSIDSSFLRPLLRWPSREVAFTFWFRASACSCQRTGPVPPSRFLAVLMVCSAESLAGLLHPAADPGVRRVSGLHLPFPCGFFRLGRSQRREHPSKLFPRQQPSPRLSLLGSTCPLVVTRCPR